jgi:hypothetical protein
MRSLPSSKVSQPTTDRSRPIVDIRAVDYRWREDVDGVQWIERAAFRVEIRREHDTEWTEIPVVERTGNPSG